MWLDNLLISETVIQEVQNERAIAKAVASKVSELPRVPGLLIDGRTADAKNGATATYKLAHALGLTRTSVVGVSYAHAIAAFEALDLLTKLVANDGPVLLVTATAPAAPQYIACCTVSRQSTSRRALRLRAPVSAETTSPDGFLTLIMSTSPRVIVQCQVNGE